MQKIGNEILSSYLYRMKNIKSHIIAVALAVASAIAPLSLLAQDAKILNDLDRTLDAAKQFVNARESNIDNIRKMLESKNINPQQRYDIYKSLYKQYLSYQFDKAMEMLDRRYELSSQMQNQKLMLDDQIDRAMLYATSGMYYEAGEMLNNEIDTLSLEDTQWINYYIAQRRFHTDFRHYTSDTESRERSDMKRNYYCKRILELTDTDNPIHQYVKIHMLTEEGRWQEAEALNLELLSKYKPNEHEYAMYAYDRARILEALERRPEMCEWFARSAMADIRTATKDNAALCSLAQSLLEFNDVDRAFRYVTISLNDALFYNAKLRPWQISGIMPDIEKAYREKEEQHKAHLVQQQEHSYFLAKIISVLAIALLALCCYMAWLLRSSHRKAHQIRQMNEQIVITNKELKVLNEKLATVNNNLEEANAVKEEYIALFLAMCSDYIDKFAKMNNNVKRKIARGNIAELERELSSSKLMDDELKNFYQMFDDAFLNLYPNFVEEFNALLKPEAHIEPKRGESLSTEHRIFALIRLGINDSSRIASLLRYSVNTIYNYRARTKNFALGDRSSFEERIKTIGK